MASSWWGMPPGSSTPSRARGSTPPSVRPSWPRRSASGRSGPATSPPPRCDRPTRSARRSSPGKPGPRSFSSASSSGGPCRSRPRGSWRAGRRTWRGSWGSSATSCRQGPCSSRAFSPVSYGPAWRGPRRSAKLQTVVDPRSRLVALAGTADAHSLAEGALWIAAEAHPGLDVSHWLGRLDAPGYRAAERRTSTMEVGEAATAIARFLFEEEGFRGNTEDYYDPRNSFLDDVLERRLGIPITLSVLYVAVAGRAGVGAAGIGLPGHFIVRTERGGRHRFLDPFH